MKKVLLFFVVTFMMLFTLKSEAQHKVEVVTPNGDTAIYIPQKTKVVTHNLHDTVYISQTVHDTVVVSEKQSFVREIEPVYISVPASLVHDTIIVKQGSVPTLGLYGSADFHSALIAPGLKITLENFDFWVFIGAYYNNATHNSYFTAGAAGFVKF